MPGGCDGARRVVITGLGAVTPLGSGVGVFWERLCAGWSGVGPIRRFDASRFQTRIAAEVKAVPAIEGLDGRRARRLDRFARFALAAAVEAWRDSCLARAAVPGHEIGVLIGSSHGGEESLLAEVGAVLDGGAGRVSPRLIPRFLGNMATAQVAIHLGLTGPSFGIDAACATGALAIGEAAEIIRRGDATAMLCGGADASITPLTLAGDQAAGALSRRNEAPERASRPFDAARDGFVLGEGAAVLVLEERQHAIERGAHIYAEVVGYGCAIDAVHETRPDPRGQGAARAIRRALEKAGLSPTALSAVFAHATGTLLGDRAEARALYLALGPVAGAVPVTAIKSALGHLLGAAGAIQAVAAAKALEEQWLPGTLNLEHPDPACRLRFATGPAQPAALRYVLSNAFGFGGHNASLVFRKC